MINPANLNIRENENLITDIKYSCISPALII